MSKKYIYLYISIILWGTSPLIVVNFKGILPPFQAASAVIIIATLSICIYYSIFKLNILKELFNCNILNFLKLGLIGFFGLFLYPIFYFYALHSDRPLEANVINYIWPIIGLVFSFFFKLEKITPKKIIGFFLGFLGIVVTTISMPGLKENKIINFDIQHIGIFISAAFGAISYGLYTALIKKMNIINKNNIKLNIQSKFIGFLFFSSFIHILFNISLLVNPPELRNFIHFEDYNFIYLIIYSIFNLSIAYLCWVIAVEKSTVSHVTIVAFMIPITGTMLLSIFKDIPLTLSSIYGLILILAGIYFHHDRERYITPLTGTCISFIIFSFLAILLPPNNNLVEIDALFKVIQILIAVFAILSAFVLSRVINQYKTENSLFISIESGFLKLIRMGNNLEPLLLNLDNYMNFIIDNNFLDNNINQKEHIEFKKINRFHINNILEIIKNNYDKLVSNDLINEFNIILKNIDQWRNSKSQKISMFEWIVLIPLVALLISISFFIRSDTIILYQLIVIIFSCSLILILLTIRDYDLRRPRDSVSFILMNNKVSDLLNFYPYIPAQIIDSFYFTKSMLGSKPFLRTKKNNDEYNIIEVKSKVDFNILISWLFFIIALIIVVITYFKN